MKTPDKIYIALADYLIRLLEKNKRIICLLFVLNLTYFVNFYMSIEFRGIFVPDIKICIFFIGYILSEIFVILLIFRLLPKFFTWLVATLTVIFFLIDAFALVMYRSLFDKGMFQVLLDTNIQEVAEYIGDYSSVLVTKIFYAVPLVVVVVLLIKSGICLISLFLNLNVRFLRLTLILFAIGLTSILMSRNLNFFITKNPVSIIRMTCLIPRAFEEIREYQEVYKNLDSTKIEITRNESELPWIIFILGESTNRNHMSIYGYDKMTTPNLLRRLEQDDLILFTDCISGATETMPFVKDCLRFLIIGYQLPSRGIITKIFSTF